MKNKKGIKNLSKAQIYWHLFKNIFLLNACTFGGGFVIISMIKKKFTEDLHWISEDEMLDMTAIAQSAPGALGVNISILTGYRIAKIPGALIGTLGATLPPLLIISILSAFYSEFRDNPVAASVLKMMRAGVAAVICDVVIGLAGKILKAKNILWTIMMVVSFAATVFWGVDSVTLLVICGLTGLLDSFRPGRRNTEK